MGFTLAVYSCSGSALLLKDPYVLESSAPVASTGPPRAYLFILAKLLTPIASTAFFLITYSPGVRLALTVSVLPLPGTRPPLLNPLAPASKLPLTPLAKLPIPPAILIAPRAATAGRTGLIASATIIRALAKSRLNLMNCLNSDVSPILLIRASNSSFTLDI